MLTKVTIESALNDELDNHLGYCNHAKFLNANSLNGRISKTVKTEAGQLELDTPRYFDGRFEPQLV